MSILLQISDLNMLEKVRPSALLLVETSRGAGHMKVVSQLASSLKRRMFDVVVATGSMNVGSQFNYGGADIEELDRLSYDPRQPIVDINGEEHRFPDNKSLREYLKSLQYLLTLLQQIHFVSNVRSLHHGSIKRLVSLPNHQFHLVFL